ncbi:MAG TPA: SURF1 family cytochrome oxidase biogenesis protein [Caulobacteraceae bacterium]|nr:SURF1 family cytochrome oxidase biogenesis protein [Caulobacteraceae bacterium]
MAILLGLGVWQIQRLHWKEGLLARIAALQASPPEPLAVVLRRAAEGLDVDYVRVEGDCPEVERTAFLRVYAERDTRPGYRIVTTCSLGAGSPYGSILIDRGFIDQTHADQLKPGAGKILSAPLVGVLRKVDDRNFVTPQNQPAQNIWFWHDRLGMAAALGAAHPAPLFLMLESPPPPAPGPTPAPVPTDIPNNHLAYALTWFGLAAALLGVYLASLWTRRRS